MLSRQASHALKALLELAREPQAWRSTHALATAQQLPEPMLELLLLRLRRAGVLHARRGRLGGFRLARPAGEISVATVLTGLGEPMRKQSQGDVRDSENSVKDGPADQVTRALQNRLERARQMALEQVSIEDLLFDLVSSEASSGSESGLLLG
ncbi:MAG: Rrf2 family transcriptional regulator [Cyanobium sp. PLM2.Bin73]|nr:MAG: Rrf2 family transcriptional regulator [Cyanobium sp. PLM2.Bin73]